MSVAADGRRSFDGHGRQAGPLRPDYGPRYADLECDECGATWVGQVDDPCLWCEKALQDVLRQQRELDRANGRPIRLYADEFTDEELGLQPADDDDPMLIDWATFWAHDRAEAEWLAEPVIPAKRSVAIFAPGGTGKSLLALWIAAKLATGAHCLGWRKPPIDVLYLDYEMTEDDLAERLENMGYGPDTDLSHLHYALLPSLPGLDQPEGGRAVLALAATVAAELVVIDTFGRAVHGDENDADTVRDWYRWTGIHLKAEGRSFLRVDHAGKDLEKGQRGTSAKNDDVDIVWRMTRMDGDVYRLTAKKRRMTWVPEVVDLNQTDDPLGYTLLAGGGYPAGTREVAADLDALGVAVDASRRIALAELKAAGKGARTLIVGAAQKYRQEQVMSLRPPGVNVEAPVVGVVPDLGVTSSAGERLPAVTGRPDADQSPLTGSFLEGGDLGLDLGDGTSLERSPGGRVDEDDIGIHDAQPYTGTDPRDHQPTTQPETDNGDHDSVEPQTSRPDGWEQGPEPPGTNSTGQGGNRVPPPWGNRTPSPDPEELF